MRIVLAFVAEKDITGSPVLFDVASFLPEEEPTFSAPSRIFNTVDDLLEALAPARIDPNHLSRIRESMEHGINFLLEISADQAASTGLLPNRAGFRWIGLTIHRTRLGDDSLGYYERYTFGNLEVGGDLETSLQAVGKRVQEYVALDWTMIETHLESNDNWSATIRLHEETAAEMYGDPDANGHAR